MKTKYNNLCNLINSFSLVYDIYYKRNEDEKFTLEDICKSILFNQMHFNLISIEYISRVCSLKISTKFYGDRVIVKTSNKTIAGRVLLISDTYLILEVDDKWITIDFNEIEQITIDKYSNL